MNVEETACNFLCRDSWLYGILHVPERPVSRGVLIVVGGPQYRVGSHRQFTLVARYLASQGIPVFRFDYRGMGDSEGGKRIFDEVGDDLRAAIDEFMKTMPTLEEVVIWGLCDAASAALFYAHGDSRVTGLVLLNPWVRTDKGIAKVFLRHYYLSRLCDRALWGKIFRGDFHYATAVRSFIRLVAEACFRGKTGGKEISAEAVPQKNSDDTDVLPHRMLNGLKYFSGRVLVILSGNDLTAKEFSDLVSSSRDWQRLMQRPQVRCVDLPQANHTFSRREWRDQIALWTKEWIQTW